jgi:hypothetical protein
MSTFKEPPEPGLHQHVKHLWVNGFLVGGVLVIIILLVVFSLQGPNAPPAPKEETQQSAPLSPPSQAAPGQPTREPAPLPGPEAHAILKGQLEERLGDLREANLKKDLEKFLHLYSPSFPQREQKRQEILRIWETYDYLNIGFKIEEVKSLESNRAFARVTWDLKTQDRLTKAIKDVTRTYNVVFAKEGGTWHIQALAKEE